MRLRGGGEGIRCPNMGVTFTHETEAQAKINLYLDILARRPDGFHNIETVMRSIDLSDTVFCGLLSSLTNIIIIIATDAPLSSLQINRLCARAQVGLVRTGNRLDHGSGDFVVGFSTASPVEHRPASLTATQAVVTNEAVVMQALFQAVAESVEEAVLNSMFCSETMSGRDGNVRYGLPAEEVAELVKEQGG